jgi:hypothetical protein
MRNIYRFLQDLVNLNVHRGVVDNLHKVHGVSRALCRIGRHDYEGTRFGRNPQGVGYVEMTCFYCGEKKRSMGMGVEDAADVAETTLENIRRHEVDLHSRTGAKGNTEWIATGTFFDEDTGDLYRVQSDPRSDLTEAVDEIVEGRGRRRIRIVSPEEM